MNMKFYFWVQQGSTRFSLGETEYSTIFIMKFHKWGQFRVYFYNSLIFSKFPKFIPVSAFFPLMHLTSEMKLENLKNESFRHFWWNLQCDLKKITEDMSLNHSYKKWNLKSKSPCWKYFRFFSSSYIPFSFLKKTNFSVGLYKGCWQIL